MISALFPRLDPPELERRFREDALPRDTRTARILMLLAIGFHMASMPMDLALVGASDALSVVWGVRGVSVAFAAMAFALLDGHRSVRFFDHTVFLWYASLLAGLLIANAFFPPSYTSHLAWDVLLTLAAFTILPLPFGRQALLAALITVGSLAIFTWKNTQPGALTDVFLVLLCGNLLGAFGSREIHLGRRRQYEALEVEVRAAADLRQAMGEIRTLRGVIPICASCKQVRTDEGVWRQVETYVRDHSLAEFSHGICPTCAKTYYDELDEPVPSGS